MIIVLFLYQLTISNTLNHPDLFYQLEEPHYIESGSPATIRCLYASFFRNPTRTGQELPKVRSFYIVQTGPCTGRDVHKSSSISI